MSFSVSSNVVTGNFNSVVLSGVYGMAASSLGGIYYTTNSGQTWTLSSSFTSYIFTSLAISSSGTYGIAGSVSNGIFYTINNGITWTQSTSVISVTINSLSLSGTNGIAGSVSNGLYYTTDSGQTWTQISNYNTLSFGSVSLYGQYGVAGSNSGIFATFDSGAQLYSTNITTGFFNSVSFSGTSGIASFTGAPNTGIYYTLNNDILTWNPSNLTSNFCVSLSNTNGIAGSTSGTTGSGIYYTITSGQTWIVSNVTSGKFNSVYLSGNLGIACSASNKGIYYTSNSGETWTQSNINTGIFRSAMISGTNAVAGSGSNSNIGLYYNTTPLCYEKNVEILCLIDDIETYVKICEIKTEMMVKTYKTGYKKVSKIIKFNYITMDANNDLECLYKMKENNNIILTGGHSILEDEITEEQKNNKYKFCKTIEDKHLVLACLSDKFEKITEVKSYELYHLLLENGHYGIYITNGVLLESFCEDY